MNCVCAVYRAESIHRTNRVGEIGHCENLLPLWGNSPVVQEPLQGDTHALSEGKEALMVSDACALFKPLQREELARQRPHWQTMNGSASS